MPKLSPKEAFPVDKLAFTPKVELQDRIAESKVKVRKSKITLEQLLQAAKDLGVTVYIPTIDAMAQAEVDSISKLGIIQAEKKAKPTPVPTELTGTLHFSHSINGQSYGPGKFTLSYLEKDIFTSLLKQDQMAMTALRDTSQYATNRSFVITLGRGNDSYSKYAKREVSSDNFDMALSGTTSINIDAAGYNPNHSSNF